MSEVPAPPGSAPPPAQQHVPPSEPPSEPQWHRLHPLTPVLRGWKVVLAVVAVIGQQRSDAVFSGEGVDRTELLVAVGLLVAAAVVGLGYALLAWRMATYRVDTRALVLRTGVLFRQERQARLDRLQAVDVVQPLLGRFAGLAELRLEVAGGSGSGVRLALLREDEARELRAVLLARAAGLSYDEQAGPAPRAPERLVVQVPAGRVLASSVLGAPTVLTVVGSAALVGWVLLSRSPEPLLLVGPALLGVGTLAWGRFTTSFNFRVAHSPDGLRLRHGLLTTRAQTVPPGRVQAVGLSQPLVWRWPGWWVVEVDVAGYSGGADSDAQQENVLLPVGSLDEALTVLSLVLPDLGVPPQDAARLARDAVTGTGAQGGFTTVPRTARWLDPLAWRRTGFRVTGTALLCRGGALTRHLVVVPHERTQSLGLRQGPLQRRLGLVTFVAHSTPGPVGPSVPHLDPATAARLLDEQARRARAARAHDRGQRWMLSRSDPTEVPDVPRG